MIFRQLFERESSTYTYLIAARSGGEALLIDPVKEETPKYLQLIREARSARTTRAFRSAPKKSTWR